MNLSPLEIALALVIAACLLAWALHRVDRNP